MSDKLDKTSKPVEGKPARSVPRQKSSVGKRLSLGLFKGFLCLLIGFGGGWLAISFQSDRALESIDNMVTTDGETVVTSDEELISAVAKQVSPSVVSIITKSTSSSPFTAVPIEGAGTGIVLSKNGYVMTNHHVIDRASQVTVVTADGVKYTDVKVIGNDPQNDVAFLKIDGVDSLTPARLGDSGSARIGQPVVAIGNALGQFQTTVTSGIISAKGRPLTASSMDGSSEEQLTDLLQTDAAINSGNSGGPLVDLSGRVIGINTAVAADANGIGFAIPINSARGVIKSVLERGKVDKALLGVRYVDITPEIASSENLPIRHGAYIGAGQDGSAIQKGSPAAEAGLKAKDIIVKVNDTEVGLSGSLGSIIGEYQPGDKIKLTVLRGEKTKKIEVTLAAY